MLFVHGFPAIWASWRGQMRAVADAGYRALAPDMRGYGESGAPAEVEAYTPFRTVGDLIAILDHFKIDEAVLVGHDFGANVAWNAAMMRPDRFSAVFGISVPFQQPGGPSFLDTLREAGKTDFYMFRQMQPESDQEWADAAMSIPGMIYWTSGHASDAERWDLFDSNRSLLRPAPEPLDWIKDDYIEVAVEAFSRSGFHGPLNYYRSIDRYFSDAASAFAGATIRQPSFFVTGALDALNGLRKPTLASMRPALPGLHDVLLLDGVGHWPQLETPDKLNTALLKFLEETRR